MSEMNEKFLQHFQNLENDQPFVKISFQGNAGSGKTYTAVSCALGLHAHLNLDTPIVAHITEPGLKRLKWRFDEAGVPVYFNESKTVIDFGKTIDLCVQNGVKILLVDSLTHFWERFVSDYQEQRKVSRLTFQDWGVLKPRWKEQFTEKFVECPIHIIACGRARDEYEYEVVGQRNGRDVKELNKTGSTMKTEKGTAYEPDICVAMEAVRDTLHFKSEQVIKAHVLKDRSTTINGKHFENPTYEDFEPAFMRIMNGTSTRKVTSETPNNVKDYDQGQGFSRAEKDAILGECIEYLKELRLGTSIEDKALKSEIVTFLFKSPSWDKVKLYQLDALRPMLENLIKFKDWWKSYEGDREITTIKRLFADSQK